MSESAPPPTAPPVEEDLVEADPVEAPAGEDLHDDSVEWLVDAARQPAPPQRRLRRTVALLAGALVFLLVACGVGAVGFSRFVHRDPPPELESAAVVGARDAAAQRLAAALSVVAPTGAARLGVARHEACERGGRALWRWDDYSWICASQHTVVLEVPFTGLEAALRQSREQVVQAGWAVHADDADQQLANLSGSEPVPLPEDNSSSPAPSGPVAVNAAVYERDGVELALHFAQADEDSVGYVEGLQDVVLVSSDEREWERHAPALDLTPLQYAASRYGGAFLVVTAQRTWFQN
ncbi:hypothetical protein [Cryptosporangium minutisporangium]|uniref:hypothetical protein n=1 Tax=Cryptosporangium minutisporangium TaxID=113569 RepID=UPI0031EDB456